MDNARPHIINNSDVSIDAVMARHPTVRLLLQPPMSPALTSLDQSLLNILASKVEPKSPSTRNEFHEAVCASSASDTLEGKPMYEIEWLTFMVEIYSNIIDCFVLLYNWIHKYILL